MDLLSSLGLENALPEQSTRLTSNAGIIDALNNSHGSDVRLGFNVCCNCGKKLRVPVGEEDGHNQNNASKKLPNSQHLTKEGSKFVTCKGCHRVRYCSDVCLKADSDSDPLANDDQNVGEETACGHSPVICALLRLCNADEDAEEELMNNEMIGASENASKSKKKKENSIKDDARYRVQTERESYPATLFNILAEGPEWFADAMTRRLNSMEPSSTKNHRRGKRDRDSSSFSKSGDQDQQVVPKRQLVLHIVGASIDSELWGWGGIHNGQNATVLDAYAEASTNLTSFLKSSHIFIDALRLVFVGPDCPYSDSQAGRKTSFNHEVIIPDSKVLLMLETHCCNYGEKRKSGSASPIPDPDIVVFFNPGFSCPDYDWSKACKSIASGTPFLITTNTEMEGFADVKYLLDGEYIDANTLPRDIVEAVDNSDSTSNDRNNDFSDEDNCDDGKTFFFSENPYAGLRVRQSGTMANDLFVKNRWIFGGLFATPAKTKKRIKGDNNVTEAVSKKQRVDKGSGGAGKNTKKKNPALI